MANFTIQTALGNKVFSSTEATSGVETTDVKIQIGAAGAAAPVSDSNPMPTKGRQLTPYRSVTATNSAALVATGARELASMSTFNRSAGERFLHLYNAASAGAVTVGATTPLLTYPMLPETGWREGWSPDAVPFSLGIVIAVTTTVSGAGGTVSANDVTVNLGYK